MTISSFTSRLNLIRLRIMLNYPTKHGRIKNHRGIITSVKTIKLHAQSSPSIQVLFMVKASKINFYYGCSLPYENHKWLGTPSKTNFVLQIWTSNKTRHPRQVLKVRRDWFFVPFRIIGSYKFALKIKK